MTNRVSFDFTGATALVTGGTSGIGHATATLLRDCGAEVTVTGTKPSARDYDVDLAGMAYRQLSVTDSTQVDELASSFSTLDILINNAGANFPGGLDESTVEGFTASVEVNLLAPFRLTTALHDALKCVARYGRSQRRDAGIYGSDSSRSDGARLRRGQGRRAVTDSQPRRAVGRRRDPGQRGRTRRHRDADDGTNGLRPGGQTGTARPHPVEQVRIAGRDCGADLVLVQ